MLLFLLLAYFVNFVIVGKIKILQESPVKDNRAGHLQPIIDFLIERGNVPVTGKFTWDKSGIGTFLFKYPLDVKALDKQFEFPKSIRAGEDPHYSGGVVFDRQYALKIHQRK